MPQTLLTYIVSATTTGNLQIYFSVSSGEPQVQRDLLLLFSNHTKLANVQATWPRSNLRHPTSTSPFLASLTPNWYSRQQFHGCPGWNNQRSHHPTTQLCCQHETDSVIHGCLLVQTDQRNSYWFTYVLISCSDGAEEFVLSWMVWQDAWILFTLRLSGTLDVLRYCALDYLWYRSIVARYEA